MRKVIVEGESQGFEVAIKQAEEMLALIKEGKITSWLFTAPYENRLMFSYGANNDALLDHVEAHIDQMRYHIRRKDKEEGRG